MKEEGRRFSVCSGTGHCIPKFNTEVQTFDVLISRDGVTRKSLALDEFRRQDPHGIDVLMSRDPRGLASCMPRK